RRNFSLPIYLRATLALATCALLLSYAPAPARAAQSASGTPQREQLLNGLPILLAYRPGDPMVLLKLRIESGAVFDLAGKEGEMALLSDLLFPDQSTRVFVTEELGGQFEVTTDYDHIDVLLSGRANEFERLADILRGAVVNMRINADDVARLRAERIKTARAASAKHSCPQPSANRPRLTRARSLLIRQARRRPKFVWPCAVSHARIAITSPPQCSQHWRVGVGRARSARRGRTI